MKTVIFLSLAVLASAPVFSQSVPNGELVKDEKDEKHFKTKAGTIVEFEFDRKGNFDDASGDMALNGDEFTAHEGNMSLKQITDKLTKEGKKLTGEWKYQNKFLNGWIYELEGMADGKEVDYYVSAKDGKIIKEKVD